MAHNAIVVIGSTTTNVKVLRKAVRNMNEKADRMPREKKKQEKRKLIFENMLNTE